MADSYYVSGDSKCEFLMKPEIKALSGQDLLTFLIDNEWWAIWGRLIRKNLFNDIVYRNVFMGEDLYLNMQIALNVKKATIIDACLYNYVQREGSATAQSLGTDFKNMGMVESIWSLFDIHHYDERIQKRISCLFFRFFIGAVRRNRAEVKPALKKYYWDKKEIRAYLWKGRKTFYFLCGGYLYAPRMTVWAVKTVVKVMVGLKGSRYDL